MCERNFVSSLVLVPIISPERRYRNKDHTYFQPRVREIEQRPRISISESCFPSCHGFQRCEFVQRSRVTSDIWP